MVSVNELKPGDKVKIVDEWNERSMEDSSGEMDKYLGTTMTVRYHGFDSVTMEEDGGEWWWNGYCIDHIVDDSEVDFEIASDDEFIRFIFE